MIVFILLLASILRLYGTSWDQGMHLHPDERMIIMTAEKLKMPENFTQFLSVDSPLNPKFFAYGSLPIYMLKFTGNFLERGNYDGLLTVGRCLSTFLEVCTVFLIYKIAGDLIVKKKNKGKFLMNKLPHLASFFYAISVLPIQSSHFFISDIPLTFFTTLLLYTIIRQINQIKKYLKPFLPIGIVFGLALATKITAVLLAAPIGIGLLFNYFRHHSLLKSIIAFTLIVSLAGVVFAITMPYGIIDFKTFKANTLEQSQMRTNPYVFPFTLQYVTTIPYWYFLENIVLYGMGLPLGILAFAGIIYGLFWTISSIVKSIRTHKITDRSLPAISLLLFYFLLYFGFMGISAVKFMRYMLPVYPILCIFAAWFIRQFSPKILIIIIFLTLIWPLSFMSIYTKPHTRILASDWINRNMPIGSKLALEHWDDGLPLNNGGKYQFLEMPMYENDQSPLKWEKVNTNLRNADYLILASNRLYIPLPKLADCSKFKTCYPETTKYYRDLFVGNLGYTKVAEFSSYPTIPFLNIPINDDNADESFTVYEHPKIIIFKKTTV